MLAIPDRRTRQGMRDYALLVIVANTPLRKGEIVGLRRSSLMEQGKKCFIRYSVKKKRREQYNTVPINAMVYEVLMSYQRAEFRKRCNDSHNPLLLTLGKHGPYEKVPITGRAISLIIEKYARLAKIVKRITPHSFRASWATNLLVSGSDPKTVSLLMGLAKAASVEPYLRSNIERKQRSAEVFCYV